MSNERIQASNPHAGENAWEDGVGERAPSGSKPSAPARMFPADPAGAAVAAGGEERRTAERLELGRDLAARLASPPRGMGTLVVLRAQRSESPPRGTGTLVLRRASVDEDVEDVIRRVEDELAAAGELVARMVFRSPERGRESFIGRTRVNDEPYRERREYRCDTIASARDLERFGENGVLVVLEAERFGDPEELIEEARRYGKRVLAILTGAPGSASAEGAIVSAAREVRTLGRCFLFNRSMAVPSEPRASTGAVDPGETPRPGSWIQDNRDALCTAALSVCVYLLGYFVGVAVASPSSRR